jgi:TPR repeat protein
MTEDVREAYLLLELEPGVSIDAVRIAYRELIKIWHPDRFPDDPKFQMRATQKASALNEAYHKTTAYLAGNCRETPADGNARAAPITIAKPQSLPSTKKRTKLAVCIGMILGAAAVVIVESKWDRDDEFARLKSTAEAGNASAQSSLGAHYENGEVVRQNPTEAARWYRQASEQGYAPSQRRLARMYHLGLGLPQDQGEAFKWLTKAADQGECTAQNDLGVMYHNGQGVPRDDVEAYKWFLVAADRGNTNAVHERNNLLQFLTPGQFAEGRRRAAATEFEQDFYDKYPDLKPYRSLVNIVAASVGESGYQDESREARMEMYARAARAELQRQNQPQPADER